MAGGKKFDPLGWLNKQVDREASRRYDEVLATLRPKLRALYVTSGILITIAAVMLLHTLGLLGVLISFGWFLIGLVAACVAAVNWLIHNPATSISVLAALLLLIGLCWGRAHESANRSHRR